MVYDLAESDSLPQPFTRPDWREVILFLIGGALSAAAVIALLLAWSGDLSRPEVVYGAVSIFGTGGAFVAVLILHVSRHLQQAYCLRAALLVPPLCIGFITALVLIDELVRKPAFQRGLGFVAFTALFSGWALAVAAVACRRQLLLKQHLKRWLLRLWLLSAPASAMLIYATALVLQPWFTFAGVYAPESMGLVLVCSHLAAGATAALLGFDLFLLPLCSPLTLWAAWQLVESPKFLLMPQSYALLFLCTVPTAMAFFILRTRSPNACLRSYSFSRRTISMPQVAHILAATQIIGVVTIFVFGHALALLNPWLHKLDEVFEFLLRALILFFLCSLSLYGWRWLLVRFGWFEARLHA